MAKTEAWSSNLIVATRKTRHWYRFLVVIAGFVVCWEYGRLYGDCHVATPSAFNASSLNLFHFLELKVAFRWAQQRLAVRQKVFKGRFVCAEIVFWTVVCVAAGVELKVLLGVWVRLGRRFYFRARCNSWVSSKLILLLSLVFVRLKIKRMCGLRCSNVFIVSFYFKVFLLKRYFVIVNRILIVELKFISGNTKVLDHKCYNFFKEIFFLLWPILIKFFKL